MTDISRWFTQTASVKRAVDQGDETEVFEVITASLACLIQEFEPTQTDYVALALFKPRKMFCALASDVNEYDQITKGTERFTVRGKIRREQGGNPRLEILLEQALAS